MDDKPLIDFNDAKKMDQDIPVIPQTPASPQMPQAQPSIPKTLDQTKPVEAQQPITPSIQHPFAQDIHNPQPKIPERMYGESKKSGSWQNIIFWIVVVVLAFGVGFLIVNGPAFAKRISFWITNGIQHKELGNNHVFDKQVAVSTTNSSSNIESIKDNNIYIPKIGVDAPILWNIDESQVQDKMLEGIVHYKNTGLPDQEGSNVFLTGHSSNYWWIKSNYNQVFALLPKLEVGDKIALTYNKIKYVYQVYDEIIVSPSELSVLKPIDGKSTLSLMTCVPLGTNFQRLIIRSELLYKDENLSTASTTATPTPSPTSSPTNTTETPVQVTPTPATTQNNSTTPPTPSVDLFLPPVN